MSVILEAENISKQYRLGTVGSGTLSHDLNRWWHTIRGKEDPYLKIGGVNDRSAKAVEDYVWALRDINFEVQRGEVLGIIGKNGAGKSTLLKLLSRVTAPTTGSIKTKGRIASLLEIGTGFHPELTGRENIFMNGAVLGMTKAEIKAKLDEIIAFSGCEMYIDTPVKRYSSGMTVRLGFAVAAHLEPEILVVDEVLAVGDAEFQKKAIGKMQDLSTGEGRTVLFVSHNMDSIKHLCTRAIVIDNGRTTFNGNVENAIQFYLKEGTLKSEIGQIKEREGSGVIRIKDVAVYGNVPHTLPQTGEPLHIEFSLKNPTGIHSDQIQFDIRINDYAGHRITWMSNSLVPDKVSQIVQKVEFILPKLNLNHGFYLATIFISVNNEVSDWIQDAFSFEVTEGDYYGFGKKISTQQGKTLMDFKVKYQ
ncbi:ABC transporter ATP-binding protein [Salinimicrobium sp. 3283s]|uniref:ABC transporter ATP-binding protein n=1 Tax=Salinimicrobium sp. 3283s TaxID=3114359 RepID=UPI0031E6A86C